MGVRGLFSCLQLSPSAWHAIALSNCEVVIDGNAMAMHVFCAGFPPATGENVCGSYDWRLGGTYAPFVEAIQSFLTHLHTRNVKVTVIFDG